MTTAIRCSKTWLETLYATYNTRKYVTPDPLQFLYDYPAPEDRELVGLVAACLAYGRVARILISVTEILKVLGPSPAVGLTTSPPRRLEKALAGFRHRFADGPAMTSLLKGARAMIGTFGSLREGFMAGYSPSDADVMPALIQFCRRLRVHGDPGHLVPQPEKGSACKRMHLFLRWMVRSDAVDPGGWHEIPPAKLIIPLDVHMHRTCLRLGATAKKNPTLKTALEITRAFAELTPQDPVRYDFALTRFGIRPELSPEMLPSWSA